LERWDGVRGGRGFETDEVIEFVSVYLVGMSMSICEKTTTLIFLDLQLVHHFIDGTGIGSSTTATVSGYFATDGQSTSLAECIITDCK
jgi:hypothetical protein